MNRRQFLLAGCGALFAQAAPRPNIVLILADDQGWGDLGCYGSPNIRTPNIDRMAAEGTRLTNFYAAPLCGPSRTGLLTGCHAPRVSMGSNLWPRAVAGLNTSETTIGRLLKDQRYSTMIIGKWHMGDNPKFLPLAHGFDRYFGLPYSNDMWPFHPNMRREPDEHPRLQATRRRVEYTGWDHNGPIYEKGHFPDLPLMSGNDVVELNPDLSTLTARYTAKALEFIKQKRSNPFFLYFAHNMPHVPLFASERFAGRSPRGLYGDAVEEIDWSVGEILRSVDDNTLVIYTSDNGPWLAHGIDGGSAGPFRAGKGTSYEGGVRMPAIFRWPGRVPASVTSNEPAANIDIFPTLARLSGAPLPPRPIDGLDIWPMLTAGAKTPHDAIYYFGINEAGTPPVLRAVRMGAWKLHLTDFAPTALYDLESDPPERFDRRDSEADRVARMVSHARQYYERFSKEIRPIGRV